MATLESTVHMIMDTLQSNVAIDPSDECHQSASRAHSMHDSTVESRAQPLTAIISSQSSSRQTRLTHRVSIERLGKAYVTFCADQPLPLFPKDAFVDSLLARPDATLFSILANALRHVSDPEDVSYCRDGQTFRDAAHTKIMADIGHGDAGLPTLQALCLVIFYDFASTFRYRLCMAAPADCSLRWPNEDCIVSHGTDFDACFKCYSFDLPDRF